MPERHRPPRNSQSYPITKPDPRLGDLVRYGKVLRLLCHRCSHSAEQSPALLAESHGYDARVSEIVGKAWCTQCGRRNVTGTVTNPAPRG